MSTREVNEVCISSVSIPGTTYISYKRDHAVGWLVGWGVLRYYYDQTYVSCVDEIQK